MDSLPNNSWIVRFGAMRRLGAALVVAIAAYLAQPDSISWHTRLVASWDLGTITYLGLAWALIARADARVTRRHALGEDQSGIFIFLFVVGAACASIVAIGFVVGTIRDLPVRGPRVAPDADHRGAGLVVGTDPDGVRVPLRAPLLRRPARQACDGARAAVPRRARARLSRFRLLRVRGGNDVAGLRRRRSPRAACGRLTLIHSVLAFVFNIAVLALSINIIASVI